MSEPVLPQEILDIITDHVALDDVERLSELSLVSQRHFLHQAQAHLFRHLRVVREVRDTDSRMMILKHKPALFHHVRSLHLYFAIPHDARTPGADPETVEEQEERLETILEVLNHLTGGVRSATFMVNIRNAISWHDYTKSPMALAIAHKFFSLPLENLWISGIKQFPLSLLHALPHLQSLKIDRQAYFADDSQVGRQGGRANAAAEVAGSGCLWKLKSLYSPQAGIPLEDSVEMLLKTTPEPLCRSLVNLDLSIATLQRHKLAWLILEESARARVLTLETLRLRYDAPLGSLRDEYTGLIANCMEDIETTKKTVPPFPLRVLDLTVGTLSPSFDSIRVPDAIISAVCTMLGSHQARPTLEIVRISLQWPFRSDPTGLLTSEPSISVTEAQRTWGPLDAIWSNAQQYPALRAVGVALSPSPVPSAHALGVDPTKLSRMTESGCRLGLGETVARGVELIVGSDCDERAVFARERQRTGLRYYTFEPGYYKPKKIEARG